MYIRMYIILSNTKFEVRKQVRPAQRKVSENSPKKRLDCYLKLPLKSTYCNNVESLNFCDKKKQNT